MNQSQKNLILKYKDQKQQAKGNQKPQFVAAVVFLFCLLAKQHQTQRTSPQGQQRGDTMTAKEWETLKQAQRQAFICGDLIELSRINKMLFEERERRQKAKERAREQEREKVLSARISTFCEKMLSAENEREL